MTLLSQADTVAVALSEIAAGPDLLLLDATGHWAENGTDPRKRPDSTRRGYRLPVQKKRLSFLTNIYYKHCLKYNKIEKIGAYHVLYFEIY